MAKPSDQDLRKVFDHIDKDKSGSITLDEFIAFVLPNASSRDKATIMGVEVAFRRLDVDKTGTINFEEFKRFVLKTPEPKEKEEEKPTDDKVLRGVFNRFDENGDGSVSLSSNLCKCVTISPKLSREEIKKTLIAWGKDPGDEETFEADFKLIDTNGDGAISFEEFKAFINREV